jgi:hypothetical protein
MDTETSPDHVTEAYIFYDQMIIAMSEDDKKALLDEATQGLAELREAGIDWNDDMVTGALSMASAIGSAGLAMFEMGEVSRHGIHQILSACQGEGMMTIAMRLLNIKADIQC